MSLSDSSPTNLRKYLLEKLTDGPKTIDELLLNSGYKRHSIRARLSEYRKSNHVVKLDNDKFDLSPGYRKGLQ